VCLQNCENWVLVSSVLFICLSLCLHGTFQLPLDDFSWNLTLRIFKKSAKKTAWRPVLIYNVFLLEWEMFQTKFVEKIKVEILFSIIFSWKSCHLWDHVEKYGRTRQVTEESIMQCRKDVVCMLVNYSKNTHTHTYII